MEPFALLSTGNEFQAFGKTREEAFSNAVLAMTNFMTDVSQVKPKETKKIEVRAVEVDELLVEFLTELLYLFDVENFFAAKVSNLKIEQNDTGWKLNAELEGDNTKKYKTLAKIKAVTHHNLSVQEEADHWMVQVVLDI